MASTSVEEDLQQTVTIPVTLELDVLASTIVGPSRPATIAYRYSR